MLLSRGYASLSFSKLWPWHKAWTLNTDLLLCYKMVPPSPCILIYLYMGPPKSPSFGTLLAPPEWRLLNHLSASSVSNNLSLLGLSPFWSSDCTRVNHESHDYRQTRRCLQRKHCFYYEWEEQVRLFLGSRDVRRANGVEEIIHIFQSSGFWILRVKALVMFLIAVTRGRTEST